MEQNEISWGTFIAQDYHQPLTNSHINNFAVLDYMVFWCDFE